MNRYLCVCTSLSFMATTLVAVLDRPCSALPVTSGLVLRLNSASGVLNSGGGSASDGQAVATWTDQAGSNNATAVASERPAFVQQGIPLSDGTFNPVLHFTNPSASGNSTSTTDFDQMATPLAMPDQFTSFFVGRVSDTFPRMVLGTTPLTAIPADKFTLFAEGGDLAVRTNGVTDTRVAIPTGEYFVATVYSDSAGEVDIEILNGASATQTGHDTTFDTSPLFVGGPINAGAGRTFDGDMAEILLFDRALNATERADVAAFLQNRWFNIVPEPSTGLLFGLFGLPLLRRMRRQGRLQSAAS